MGYLMFILNRDSVTEYDDVRSPLEILEDSSPFDRTVTMPRMGWNYGRTVIAPSFLNALLDR
jgi:hypothetical protein